MFLTRSNTYYTANGGQHASKAWYLLLATLDTTDGKKTRERCITCNEQHPTLYAVARKIALSQCGHFMMGTARIGGQSVIVSGSFGSDGLPKHMGMESWHTVSATLLPYFTRVSAAASANYWHSGHDYHAGKSGDYSTLKTWAMAHLVYERQCKAGKAKRACHWPQPWQRGELTGPAFARFERGL